MLPAVDAKRAGIETGISGVGLRNSHSHRGIDAAILVRVGLPHGPDESLGALFRRQHNVAFLLAGCGVDLSVIFGNWTPIGQDARASINRFAHNPSLAPQARGSAALRRDGLPQRQARRSIRK